MITPKIATVNQPLREIGREAAALLLEQLDGKAKRNIILNAALEAGSSVRKVE